MKVVALTIMIAALVGCQRHERADIHLCESIMDRIVDLELTAMNIHDRTLAERRRLELRRDLAPELQACVGRRAPKNAHVCVESARTMTELTHACLAL